MLTNLRLGFSANSSSVHSVVLGGSGINLDTLAEDYTPELGCAQFGWQEESYHQRDSIVNYGVLLFAGQLLNHAFEISISGTWGKEIYDENAGEDYLLSLELKDPDTLVLLQKFFRAFLKKDSTYIDYQGFDDVSSQFTEGGWEDRLWKFIATVSEIQTDNDNH